MEIYLMITLLPILIYSQGTNEDAYRITSLQSSTGLYYEHLGPMKLTAGTWRIAVFLNISKIYESFQLYKNQVKKLHYHCPPAYAFECSKLLNNHYLQAKIEVAERLQAQLNQETIDLSRQSERKYPALLPPGMRSRRSTPMLGFLGGIIGPVAGLLTYEDGQQIEQEINDLNQAQANVSLLMARQTHVIRAQLEEIHQHTKRQDDELTTYKNQLKELKERTNELHGYVPWLNCTQTIERIMRVTEASLDNYIRSADLLLHVVRSARKGEMHPSLLTTQQVEPVIRDVQDHSPKLMFPVAGPQVDLDELAKVLTTTIIYKNGLLKILLDIPLLGRTDYAIYKLHPVPVSQAILNNGTGRAYVQPKFSYICIGESQRTYVLMQQTSFNECKQIQEQYICKGNLPVHEAVKYKTCESEVLLRPTKQALRACTIQITYDARPHWTLIKTLDAWLYSTPAEISAEVECGTERRKIELSGLGLIQLTPGCKLRTEETTLPGLSNPRGSSEILYEPGIHLDIEWLSPNIQYNQKPEIPAEFQLDSGNPDMKNDIFEENEETLDELERKWYEFSSERRNQIKQNHLIHGAYAFLTLIFFGLLLIPCHAKIMAILMMMWTGICKRTSSSKKVNQEINPGKAEGRRLSLATLNDAITRSSMRHSARKELPTIAPRTATPRTSASLQKTSNNEKRFDVKLVTHPSTVKEIPVQKLEFSQFEEREI